jgi:uroporphyrinogen decarboxylase
MTSRERVWKAIHFEEPDRVPIDIGSNDATGMNVDAYLDLVEHLGYELGPPKANEFFYMLARMDEAVRERLHCDVVQIENPSPRWNIENRDWKTWTNQRGRAILVPGGFDAVEGEDGSVLIRDKAGRALGRMPKGGLYFDYVESVSLTMGEVKMVDPGAWARSIPLYTDEQLRRLEEAARWYFENTEYSLHGAFGKGGMTMVPSIAGHSFSDWLCILVAEPRYAYSIIQATAERAVENLALYLQAVGRYVDTVFVSPTDYGTQNGEMFNPEIWREVYLPHYRKMNDYVHAHSHARTFFHCCGSIYHLIRYFIEAGVDILNPIQTNAKNMDARGLKKEFGGQIVFWGGGTETQTVLPFGSEEEVRDQVRERMTIFAPGGGFVFNQIHVIQHGVPPRNILAMVDSAFEFGRYPIGGAEAAVGAEPRKVNRE